MSEKELCPLPLTTIWEVPAVTLKLSSSGLPPVRERSIVPSGPKTVTVRGAALEKLSRAEPEPWPAVNVNDREEFLLVTAPLNVVVMVLAGAGVATGGTVWVGDGAVVGVGAGVTVGNGVTEGAGVGSGVDDGIPATDSSVA